MSETRTERCETCRFWERKGPPLSAATRDPCEKNWLGTCHIEPPKLMMQSGIPVGLWPQTPASRFCGEWEPEFEGPDGPDDGERSTVVPFRPAA